MHKEYASYTIGPFVIDKKFQGRKYGEKLLNSIKEKAKENNIQFCYLQGIDGFYNKYGFHSCCSRSKIVLQVNSKNNIKKGKVKDVINSDQETLAAIYNQQSEKMALSSIRDLEIWDWLLNNAKETWYFYKPQKVLFGENIIGYFTSDPSEPTRLRECCCVQDPKLICNFLEIVNNYFLENGFSSFEIMTPRNSLIHKVAKQKFKCSFQEFYSPKGSQLMNITNYKIVWLDFLEYLIERKNKITQNKINSLSNMFDKTDDEIFEKLLIKIMLGEYSFDFEKLNKFVPPDLFEFINNFHIHNSVFIYQGDNY